MSSAEHKDKETDDCSHFALSMTAYIDGELDADHMVDVEAHLESCEGCAAQVDLARAVRASLKRVPGRRASESLRDRALATMAQERRRGDDAVEATAAGRSPAPRMLGLRYAFGLAAAAGVVFALGLSRYNRPPVGDLVENRGAPVSTASTFSTFDSLLDELVALHAEPLPPETKNPEELPRFDPLVGVPVRRPAFQPFGATFDGARVHAMRNNRAALIYYTLLNRDGHGQHRVTVYVFDPQKSPLQPSRLEPRVVRERPVFVGTMRGYSVAAATRSGVGYAVAADMGSDESTQLVLAAAAQ